MVTRDRNEYMRVYMAERYKRRRAEAIERLGGKCVDCGTTENLEFDHKDRSQKLYDIGKRLAGVAEAKLWAELGKCELRCDTHHNIRSRQQLSVEHGGGKSGKKNCKCVPCKERRSEYMRNRRRGRAPDGRAQDSYS